MFSAIPFESYQRWPGYESFNPWTNDLRVYSPYSSRRYSKPCFLWELQPHLSTDDDYYTVRQATKQRESRPRKSQKDILYADALRQKHHDRCQNDCSKYQVDENQLEETSRVDDNSITDEDNDKVYAEMNRENQPEVKIPDVIVPKVGVSSDELAAKENRKEEVNSEKAKENLDDAAKKRLDQIEEKLIKAHDIASKEIFYSPEKTEKQKLYLTEMLLRCILDLDMIETNGDETVKIKRKEAVLEIQALIDQVERT